MLEFISNVWLVLKPFLIGTLIAYMLAVPCNKLYDKFSKRLKNKYANVLAVVIVEVSVLFLLALFMLLVVPQCITSITNIISNIPDYINSCQSQFDKFVNRHQSLQDAGLKHVDILENIRKFVFDKVTNDTTILFNTLYTQAYSLGTILVNVLVAYVSSVFILFDRQCAFARFTKLVRAVFPTSYKAILKGVDRINVIFRQFVVGKALDSIIVGILCFIVFLICKIPYPLTIAVFICITNMIPVIGPIIGAVPGVFIIFAESPMKALQFAIIVLIIQQIDGHILGPKCIGHSTGLSTFWVLFAVLTFGRLFGIVGMFFGVPIFAVIYEGVNLWIDSHQSLESHTFLQKVLKKRNSIIEK